MEKTKEKSIPRQSSTPLHININAELFNTDTTAFREVTLLVMPRIIKFFKTNTILKQRILLGVLSIWGIGFFWVLLFGFGGNNEIDRIPDLVVGGGDSMDVLQSFVPTEGKGLVTAILLNWMRLGNVKTIAKHLCQYEMFKEIIIWNNNPDVHLSTETSIELKCPKVKVYNSPRNIYFTARYMGCQMASTPYCYFQDDDYIVRHLRSMYANFLRFPHLIHTDANAASYASSNWKWCFFDDFVDLHTCFAWLGYGTFASRSNVIKFQNLVLATEMDPAETAFGDNYFTTFMNQVPYQLENGLLERSHENSFTNGEEGRVRNEIYMHKALVRLYDHLFRKTGNFGTKEFEPLMEQRDVRSPCANDRCLFMTNKRSFPDARILRYRPYINISESERVHESLHQTEHFIKFPYSYAVDGNEVTVWRPDQRIRKGDYIGLDLLLAMPVPLKFRLLVDHHLDYFQYVDIGISYDGIQWFSLESTPRIACKTLNQATEYGDLHECTFVVQETGFRFVRLLTTRDWEFKYGLYDFSFGGKVDGLVDY